MTDLDKKSQKAETYLVQSVIEAQEKKNTERVDVLITNAIKQLKMSRFKPDQSTCYSLTYLARINPKIFSQSTQIKELLKSLIRRDNAPNAIKGAKNDIMLPVLAANILIACCDGPEIKSMVLSKIEHWLANPAANQKGTPEMVQHLLSIICMRARNIDQQTITTLIEMRHHWVRYLRDNYDTYGPIPKDLCRALRKLIQIEKDETELALYLDLLLKSDSDILGLTQEVSKFITKQPIRFTSIMGDTARCQVNNGNWYLRMMIFNTFNKLLDYLKHEPTKSSPPKNPSVSATIVAQNDPSKKTDGQAAKLTVPLGFSDNSESMKVEDVKPIEIKIEVNSGATPKVTPVISTTKKEEPKKDLLQEKATDDEQFSTEDFYAKLYVKSSRDASILTLPKSVADASFIFTANTPRNLMEKMIDVAKKDSPLDDNIFDFWTPEDSLPPEMYTDFGLHNEYRIPVDIRQELIGTNDARLIEFGLRRANPSELVRLLTTFGLKDDTVVSIIRNIEAVKLKEQVKSQIKNRMLLNTFLERFVRRKVSGATELMKTLSV